MVSLGLVVARFNDAVTEPMAEAARETAADRDAVVVDELNVPGAYDSPLAADRLARRDDVDAVAVVGAIVTGDTDHDRVIATATAEKLTDVSLDRDTPVAFGVSGPGMSGAEARERIDKGADAATAAIDLAEELDRQTPDHTRHMSDAYDFSERIGRVEPSATLAISNLAATKEAEGADIVDLSVGEPDFDTPPNVVEAGKQALDAGHTGYTSSNGVPRLKEAIAEKLRGNGIDADADEVIVTPGGKQALYETFQTLIDEESEVVLLDPAWVSYEAMAKLAGAELSRVDLAPHGFQLEPALDDLAETVSDDTELLVVNSPSNPTGAVFSQTALEGVRDLAVEHDVAVISDEIYERIVYDADHVSLASLDGMADRTVTINGFSKAYSMTGWRLGYLHATDEFVGEASKLHSHSVSCATNFVQRAGIEALENTGESVEEMRDAFADRRDLLVDLFDEHGVDIDVGDGAFYMMIPVSEPGSGSDASGDEPRVDDQAWCERAIEEAGVACVPGSAFNADGHVRISYAASEERLREAVDRLVANDLL